MAKPTPMKRRKQIANYKVVFNIIVLTLPGSFCSGTFYHMLKYFTHSLKDQRSNLLANTHDAQPTALTKLLVQAFICSQTLIRSPVSVCRPDSGQEGASFLCSVEEADLPYCYCDVSWVFYFRSL